MGGLMSYFRGLFGNKEMRILILGLDGAGKTTLLYRLQVNIKDIYFNICCHKILLTLQLFEITTVFSFILTGWRSGYYHSYHRI